MAVNLSNAEARELNELVVPQLLEVYDQEREVFTEVGWKTVQRSLKKPLVTTHTGIFRTFEPAMLLGFTTHTETLWKLFEIGKLIPFWGNYGVWESVRSLNSVLYRKLTVSADERASEVEQYLSFADNGSRTGPPLIGEAMRNFLDGNVLRHYRTEFPIPIPATLYSHFMTRYSILSVMWAFGGSEIWPRTKLETELTRCADIARYLLADPPHMGI